MWLELRQLWLIMTIVNIASQQLVNKTSISPELLTHTGSYTQLWLFFLVAQTLIQDQDVSICLSYTGLGIFQRLYSRKTPLSMYPHYYTGAVASYGYPAPDRWGNRTFYFIELGGQPINTYTTLTLHSSPSSLQSNFSLEVTTATPKVEGTAGVFSKKQYTPLSVFTPSKAYIGIIVQNTTSGLIPPFIFSFRGKQHRQWQSIMCYNKNDTLKIRSGP